MKGSRVFIASALPMSGLDAPEQAPLVAATVTRAAQGAPGFAPHCDSSGAAVGSGAEFVISGAQDVLDVGASAGSISISGPGSIGILFPEGDRITIGGLNRVGRPDTKRLGMSDFTSATFARRTP